MKGLEKGKEQCLAEQGLALSETLLSLAVLTGLLLGLNHTLFLLHNLKQEESAARYISRVHESMDAYARSQEIGSWLGALRSGSDPIEISLTDLKAGGFLSAHFPESSAFAGRARIMLSAHHVSGGLLRMAIELRPRSSLRGISAGQAGRILAQAGRRTGHVRMEEGEIFAVFMSGGRLEEGDLASLYGSLPLEGSLVSLIDMPFPGGGLGGEEIDRIRLTEALGREVSEITKAYETELNERLAAFDFHDANLGTDPLIRKVRETVEGESIDAYKIAKHACPSGFVATVQLYPSLVSDEEIKREKNEVYSADSVNVDLLLSSGVKEGVSFLPWWRATGIFRKTWPEGEDVWPEILSEEPVNTERVLEARARGGVGGSYGVLRGFRQRSVLFDRGDHWTVTRMAALRDVGDVPQESMPAYADWKDHTSCGDLGSCEIAHSGVEWMHHRFSLDGSAAFTMSGTRFKRGFYDFIYSYEDGGGCSLFRRYTNEGYHLEGGSLVNSDGSPYLVYRAQKRADLCSYLSRHELSVVRKCVPETGLFYEGLKAVLERPEDD